MRIIAGAYRGRVLKTLRGLELRPTSERLRESLFDVLGDSVRGSVFLDCYAGSGAVGLEAFSRGAGEVFLLEENAAAGRLMEKNLALLGTPSHVHLVRAPVRQGLRRLEKRGLQAHFCFLDPPYGTHGEWARTFRWLDAGGLIASGGFLILQHSRRELPDERLGRWKRVRLLIQGSNALSFYQALSEPSGSAASGTVPGTQGSSI